MEMEADCSGHTRILRLRTRDLAGGGREYHPDQKNRAC